ncbi:uncharacterized protein LOC131881546, partial [Tigriopus californicus]|uniref:uncharacterized protein LOC131881546 n=1 Tax=Tigriopus californicus TaxID=6832 RepID=UPI0027DAAF95
MGQSSTAAIVVGLVLSLVCSHFSSGEPRGFRQSLLSDSNKTSSESNNREGKVFSLFNIVQFKNEGCRSSSTISSGGTGSTNRNGTCYTSTECATRGGSAAGSCAAGFGVCCVFLVSRSGATVAQNCTYLRNPSFPNAYAETSQVSYNIQKCDRSVCRLRLDFESFTILGTGNTLEFVDETNQGGTCLDMFTISTNTGNSFPIICGQNTGQHIYVEMGCLESDTATLNFNFNGATAVRMWEIKATQVKCNTEGQPQNCGCLQYHTGLTGRITTFNFLPTNDNHLANQEYSICIRQEAGMCCVEYLPCADTSSYSLEGIPDDVNKQDSQCSKDYVGIEGGSATCNASPGDVLFTRFCGTVFTTGIAATLNMPICDCSKPFRLDIFTDDKSDNAIDDMENEEHSR